MMRVLISDSLPPVAREIFEKTGKLKCDFEPKITAEELKERIKDYHGLVVRSRTKVTAEILERATNLRVIGRAGTGVDNIDVERATKMGVVVMNTPGGNTITTAEHTIALLFALARNIPQADASLKKGEWERKKFEGVELTDKTLGVIGAGNIGSVVAQRALGLKMNVIVYDPYISEEMADRMGVRLVTLDELFRESDFITIHVPLTQDTRNLINRDTIKKMKKGARIVNCARGGIVNEADLYEAIKEGHVAGAAVDVFEKEPPPEDLPLLGLENVVATPHLGASTREAQTKVARAIAEQMADYLINGTIRNAVNVPSIPQELLEILRPYISLGERLGSFQGQLLKGRIEEVTVEYSGDVVEYDVAPITIACIKGMLEQIMEQNINFVNAPHVAKERGIKVVEVKSSRPIDFASSITVKVKGGGEEHLVEGALFGKADPRIVKIDKFFLDAIPEGYLLVIHNEDKPGVIGKVGTLLGDNNINIARLHLGREAIGGEAVSVWNIDTPLPEELMKKLAELPYIISAVMVRL